MFHFDVTYIEARALQSERDEVQEINELAEYDALGRRILVAQFRKLFNQRLNLGRGSPCINIESTEDALPRSRSGFIELKGRCFKVDGECHMTHRTFGLSHLEKCTTAKVWAYRLLNCGVDVLLYALPVLGPLVVIEAL